MKDNSKEWHEGKILCPNCATLQAQVAGMKGIIAKDLFLSGKLPDEPEHYECRWCKQWAFSPGEIEHEEGCIFFILSTPTAGEWISVRREDLKKLVREFELQYPESGMWKPIPNAQEAYDRLKAALGTGGEE